MIEHLKNKRIKILIISDITLWLLYESWNFNSGNYLFTTDTK